MRAKFLILTCAYYITMITYDHEYKVQAREISSLRRVRGRLYIEGEPVCITQDGKVMSGWLEIQRIRKLGYERVYCVVVPNEW